MKVAIEFYGHLRTFRNAYPTIISHLINQFDNPDIFIHTWSKTDHSNITWHNLDGLNRGNSTSNEDIVFLNEIYKPKEILVEDQIVLDEERYFEMIMTENKTPLSMIKNVFYTKWRVNELRKEYQRKNNIEYDFVIQSRLDLYFKKEFKIKDYISYKTVIKKNPINIDISKKFFYASDNWIENHGSNDLIYAGGSDVLYFAKPNAMDKVLSIYKNIDSFDLKKLYYSNEYLVFYSASKNQIETVQINFKKDIDFGILRTEECLNYLRNLSNNTQNSLEKTKPRKIKGLKKLLREIARILKQLAIFLEKRI